MSVAFLATREIAKPDPAATGSQPTYILPNSVWAQTVPGSPIVKGTSSTIMANLLTQGYASGGNPALFSVSGFDGVYRYVVHGQQLASTVGWTQVLVNPGTRWSNSPSGIMQKPIPIGAQSTPGSDHQLAIWDLDNHTQGSYTGEITHNFWVYNPHGTCNVEMMQPLDGSYGGFGGWSQDPLTTGTMRASGAPFIADPITYAEWQYGTISHVLGLTVGLPTVFYVGPAIASDGTTTYASKGVPYGSLFWMPTSLSPSTYNEAYFAAQGSSSPILAAQVFQALQTYGAYAVDQTVGNGCGIAVEGFGPWLAYNPNLQGDGNDWPLNMGLAYNAFKGMPWSSMEVIVPTAQLGSGGGGSSSIGGNTIGTATTTPASITLPNTIASGDILLLFCTFVGQGWNSAPPTGWSLLSNASGDKAGTNFACYTKTATSGDSGAVINIGFAGSQLVWSVIDVKNSPGATGSRVYQDFGTMTTGPSTLTSSQNLTILYATIGSAATASYWPDRYTQVNWTTSSPYSGGTGVFSGPAYGDVFVSSNTQQNVMGIQVAV